MKKVFVFWCLLFVLFGLSHCKKFVDQQGRMLKNGLSVPKNSRAISSEAPRLYMKSRRPSSVKRDMKRNGLKRNGLKRKELNHHFGEKNRWYIMIKCFFISLFDPTCSGLIVPQSCSSSLSTRSAAYSVGGALSSGSSFGPVCGPNGCF
jgi:hypothetical protein